VGFGPRRGAVAAVGVEARLDVGYGEGNVDEVEKTEEG
jgi:hypothetical protein